MKEILIADDDVVVRYLLTAMLEANNCTPVGVESGGACLSLLTERQAAANLPSALFLDVQLGDMSGQEVYAELRKSIPAKDLPIVVLSANPRSELNDLGFPEEPAYYLEKPFDASAVAAALGVLFPDE